jgi:uncharacterized membrane protein YqiK
MTKPIVLEHNVETNEVIEREMTDVEYAEYQKQQEAIAKSAELQAKAEAEKAKATAKLEALGLTADDLKALGL